MNQNIFRTDAVLVLETRWKKNVLRHPMCLGLRGETGVEFGWVCAALVQFKPVSTAFRSSLTSEVEGRQAL